MNAMNAKKLYIWRLATFLYRENKKMSGNELAEHLNRNGIPTKIGTSFKGGRGTFKLIEETWKWVNDDLGLPLEADHIAKAFVDADGLYAYNK